MTGKNIGSNDTHPYKVYKVIPEAYPCKGIREDWNEEQAGKDFENHLKGVSERNKNLLSLEMIEYLRNNPRIIT